MADNPNLKPSVLWYYDTGDNTGPPVLKFIAFAATMEENHQGQATVSKYPVQKGFEVSNHMIRHNRIVNIRAYIPETLIGGLDVEGAAAGYALGGMANKYLGVNAAGVTSIAGGIIADPIGVANNYLSGAVSAAAPVIEGVTNTVDTATNTVAEWTGVGIGTDLSGSVEEYLPSTSRRLDAFDKIVKIQELGIMCELSTILREYKNLVLVSYSVPTTDATLSCMFVDLTFEEVLVVDATGKEVSTLNSQTATSEEKEDARKRAEGAYDSGAETIVKDTVGDWFA